MPQALGFELQGSSLNLHRNSEVGHCLPHFTDKEVETEVERENFLVPNTKQGSTFLVVKLPSMLPFGPWPGCTTLNFNLLSLAMSLDFVAIPLPQLYHFFFPVPWFPSL